MELVPKGSFVTYLMKTTEMEEREFLQFAKDIATGMNYLVSKKMVHRDLAARNVLIDSDNCVKISDFGLAQLTNSNGYYIGQTLRELPIKW